MQSQMATMTERGAIFSPTTITVPSCTNHTMDLQMFKDIRTRCHEKNAVLLINKVTIILNNLQQHVSAFKCHLQAEYKGVYTIQCHKMDMFYNLTVLHCCHICNCLHTNNTSMTRCRYSYDLSPNQTSYDYL